MCNPHPDQERLTPMRPTDHRISRLRMASLDDHRFDLIRPIRVMVWQVRGIVTARAPQLGCEGEGFTPRMAWRALQEAIAAEYLRVAARGVNRTADEVRLWGHLRRYLAGRPDQRRP